ncbi:ly6/PLAUR domain-containing protein 5-like [Pelodiscus sinensis]|uniref:ly6/PLAUR domain-containing protein 5-like n=1 Tax=Pelodiscus sinensis TaxID=13735 RepID=UPI003F6B4FE4
MLPPDSRQVLKGALCCLLSALLLQVAVGLQCYSYTGSFTNEISLGQVPLVTCGPAQNVCAEWVTALSVSEGVQRMVVVMKKGCYMTQTSEIISNTDGNLPSYSHARFCNTSLCNNLYQNNSNLPAFPTAPSPTNSSTSLLCYSCMGTTPESCSPSRTQQTRCYDSPGCFNGTANVTMGDLKVPVYVRSCGYKSCGSLISMNSWRSLKIQTTCCFHPLCNRGEEPKESSSPLQRPPTLVLLLLLGTLALGG